MVAPPGSGKTLLGVELIRRLEAPALVLAPNTAVQAQWPRAIARFGVADPDAAGIACLTYQSLCRVSDPGGVLRAVAEARWAAERAAVTGGAVEPEWTGAAAERRERDLRRIVAGLKREVARGAHDELTLADLLTPGARARLVALGDVRTVVLDECHHLASLWGYLVRAVLRELGDAVHVIGLTATPPAALSSDEAELYATLLGPVDFTVPTPAVVRDGHLAPFQELAWLTEPLRSETQWLAEHDERFGELITRLHDLEPDAADIPRTGEGSDPVLDGGVRDAAGPPSFPEWVIMRIRHRDAEPDGAAVPWERFQRRRPALARAGVRFLGSAGLALPDDAPRGEGYRRPPDLEDWLVLLEDYALRALAPDPSPHAAERYEAIAAALRDLGFTLTRQGMRRGTSQVDRLLTASAAKPLALVEILAAEAEVRGDGLRALMLCDSERAAAQPDPELRGVLDPEAGSAVRAVHALGEDLRTAPLRPVLVTGRALRCLPSDAEVVRAAIGGVGVSDVDADGLVRIDGGADWTPRRWVRAATDALTRGDVQALVGTRALLGEGWDAPALNVLVDLTVAATSVSVQQMRGRTLRLDPADPEKLASNWDVVCVAPDHARGTADYERFVRKHAHLLAPAEDGVIEAGPSHVHPSLSPFGPPDADAFAEINRSMLVRAREHARARERWRIGTPYDGTTRTTLVLRPRTAVPARAAAAEPPAFPVSQREPLAVAWAGLVGALIGGVAVAPALFALGVAAPAGVAVAAARLRRARRMLPAAVPLDLAGHAVADALADAGELRPGVARTLVVEPRTSGYVRCRLTGASEEESARFTAALEEVLEPVAAPRYLVSRLVAVERRSHLGLVARALTGRAAFVTEWHAVPAWFAAKRERAERFHAAWSRWLGPSELRFTQRTSEARELRAAAAAQTGRWEVQRRDVWS